MALREVVVALKADSTGFSQGIARAAQSGNQFYRQMESGERRSQAAAKETQRALQGLTSEFSSIKAAAGGLGAIMAGAFATSSLIQAADSWTNLSSRLKLASTDSAAATENMRMLMDISQRTGTSIEANASLFARVSKSMTALGYSAQTTGKLTELLATSLRLSGASAEEASSVTTQFSQSLASGVLRGEEFNSIMENGGRFAQALAEGLGVTVGQLRQMANNGELTTQKIMPALLGQFQKVREEGESMGATVAASSQRVSNAFLEWVGGANGAYGATTVLASGLDFLSKNINGVANTAAVLVGLGLARYLGGVATSAAAAVGGVRAATSAETQLAVAQLNAAKSAEAAARQTASRAAQARLAATSLQAQMVAEIELRAAQANVAAAAVNTAAAGARVAETASTLSRIGGGLLSIMGGWPGVIIAAGAGMYALYQHTQASHKEALAFADSMGTVAAKLAEMDTAATGMVVTKAAQTTALLKSNLADIDERIRQTKDSIKGASAINERTSSDSYNWTDLTDKASITEKLIGLNRELNESESERSQVLRKISEAETLAANASARHEEQMRSESVGVMRLSGTIEDLNRRAEDNRVSMINAANGTIMLTNAYRLLDSVAGKTALKGPAASPVIDTGSFNPQQAKAWQQMQDTLNNSTLSGAEKAHAIAEQRARDLGLEGAAYTKAVQMQVDAYNNEQKQLEVKKASTAATRDHTRALSEAQKVQDQYADRMRGLDNEIAVQIELAKNGKYAAMALAESQKNNVKWSDAEREAYAAKAQALADATEKADQHTSALKKQQDASRDLARMVTQQRADLMAADAPPMNPLQKERYDKQADAQSKYRDSEKTPQDLATLNESIKLSNEDYEKEIKKRSDISRGSLQGFIDFSYEISDYSKQVTDGITSSMGGALDNLSGMLEGQKADWRAWGVSILKTIEQVALKMAVVQGLQAVGGAFGLTMSAKGNVFEGGTGLSAYSNSVVSKPTMFAFAKGAGLMGEAGPEAIMPLTRDGQGRLGVRASGGGGSDGGITINSVVNVNGGNNSSGSDGNALGKAYQETVDNSVKEGIARESLPGGIIWRANQKR